MLVLPYLTWCFLQKHEEKMRLLQAQMAMDEARQVDSLFSYLSFFLLECQQ